MTADLNAEELENVIDRYVAIVTLSYRQFLTKVSTRYFASTARSFLQGEGSSSEFVYVRRVFSLIFIASR